jgi:hypothetical protein
MSAPAVQLHRSILRMLTLGAIGTAGLGKPALRWPQPVSQFHGRCQPKCHLLERDPSLRQVGSGRVGSGQVRSGQVYSSAKILARLGVITVEDQRWLRHVGGPLW